MSAILTSPGVMAGCRAAELYLKANKSRQKALQKAMAAQELAGQMKRAIDDKLYQIQRGLPMQRDIWELYGATRLRAQELLDRAEALQRESNATTGSRPTPPPI